MCDNSCSSSAKGTITGNKDKLLPRLETVLSSVHRVIGKGICRDLERLSGLCVCPKAGPA